MRKYIALVFALICVLELDSCSPDNAGYLKTTEESTHVISADSLAVFAIDENPAKQATNIMKNQSNQKIVYEYSYGIEVEQNRKRYGIEHDAMLVQTIQMGLNPGERETFVCNRKDSCGIL